MSLELNGKRFMNLQEAVAWLLQNNALPFQSTANYAPNTEIAKTTIINPSPAEIKVGALVLFADSKVGTVSGITTNGFMVGSDYTDIKNALAYIVSVTLNASRHLITTLSDGTTKDAGLVKEVDSMSINASQHLIVNYNNGTSNDLGAIFSGNVNIAGNLTADSIIENMTGYSITPIADAQLAPIYYSVSKTGNKLTYVFFGTITRDSSRPPYLAIANMVVPNAVMNKLYPYTLGTNTHILAANSVTVFRDMDLTDNIRYIFEKWTSNLDVVLRGLDVLTNGAKYFYRIEQTFLLSNNVI